MCMYSKCFNGILTMSLVSFLAIGMQWTFWVVVTWQLKCLRRSIQENKVIVDLTRAFRVKYFGALFLKVLKFWVKCMKKGNLWKPSKFIDCVSTSVHNLFLLQGSLSLGFIGYVLLSPFLRQSVFGFTTHLSYFTSASYTHANESTELKKYVSFSSLTSMIGQGRGRAGFIYGDGQDLEVRRFIAYTLPLIYGRPWMLSKQLLAKEFCLGVVAGFEQGKEMDWASFA